MTTLATDPDLGPLSTTLVDRRSLDEAVDSVQAAARRHRTWLRGGWVLVSVAAMLLTGVTVAADPWLLATATVGWACWLALASATLPLLTPVDLVRRLGMALVTGLASVTVLDLGRAGLVDAVAMVLAGAVAVGGWWARIRLNRPRTIVVGSSAAVQRAITDWKPRRDVDVVGAEVVGRDQHGHWLPIIATPCRERPGTPWSSSSPSATPTSSSAWLTTAWWPRTCASSGGRWSLRGPDSWSPPPSRRQRPGASATAGWAVAP